MQAGGFVINNSIQIDIDKIDQTANDIGATARILDDMLNVGRLTGTSETTRRVLGLIRGLIAGSALISQATVSIRKST